MNWLTHKYIGQVSGRLERFKRVNDKTYNFRCPSCGDSRKDRTKARGYLFEGDRGKFVYHCHNCHISLGFSKFLQLVDEEAYSEYRLERFKERQPSTQTPAQELSIKMAPPVFVQQGALEGLKKISQLPHTHPAHQYVSARRIPASQHFRLYYAPRFKELCNRAKEGMFREPIKNEHPRLILPFVNENNDLVGFTGRAFGSEGKKYITVQLSNHRMIYGLDRCDRTKDHFVVEGPIDSLFLDNAIAVAGQQIPDQYVNEHSIFIFDNEKRNQHTVQQIDQAIQKQYRVVIFPDELEHKDINEMVLAGVDVQRVLRDNVYSGLSAIARLSSWSRVKHN